MIKANDEHGTILYQEHMEFGTGYTSNDAEYLILRAALRFLDHILYLHTVALIIEGDSELIRNQVGTFKEHVWFGWKTDDKFTDYRNEIRALLQQLHSFTYNHRDRKDVVKVLGH